MTSYFAQVIKHARFTCDPNNVTTFRSNFVTLKHLLDKLTVTDIQLDHRIIDNQPVFRTPHVAGPPCRYVHIYSNEHVSISVFILSESYTMPIHDHPQINGILKAISGKICIQSYTVKTDSPNNIHHATDLPASMFVPVTKEQPKELTECSECAVLTPTEGNFHAITAVGGPAAFFDILSPPYESVIPVYGARRCSFYAEVDTSNTPKNGNIFLQRIPCPSHYYCDNVEYELPFYVEN